MELFQAFFVIVALGVAAGIYTLLIWSEKGTIRRDVANHGGQVTGISTSINFFTRVIRYRVDFTDSEGRDQSTTCRVSFFLGVIWEGNDSFWKHLVPRSPALCRIAARRRRLAVPSRHRWMNHWYQSCHHGQGFNAKPEMGSPSHPGLRIQAVPAPQKVG